MEIYRVDNKLKARVWNIFKKYHYLNGDLHKACSQYVGVINGVGDNKLNPDENISVEEFVALLSRAVAVKKNENMDKEVLIKADGFIEKVVPEDHWSRSEFLYLVEKMDKKEAQVISGGVSINEVSEELFCLKNDRVYIGGEVLAYIW